MDEYHQHVYDFAMKWLKKFNDVETDYLELVDHYLADDCEALGFKMDCGESLYNSCGVYLNHHEESIKAIAKVSSIPVLGAAIYSKWRYYNHWAMDGMEIKGREDLLWFVRALARLAVLAKTSGKIERKGPAKGTKGV